MEFYAIHFKHQGIKGALSTLKAHFYVISFTKNDLSINSTTFSAVEGAKVIKIIELISLT